MEACPFCERVASGEIFESNEFAVSTPDRFPVMPGHTLVVSRRHEPDWFALSDAEQAGMIRLARTVRDRIAVERRPDGWNVGVNVGTAAGQTVMHVHLHVIPRHLGDGQDPRRVFGADRRSAKARA